MNERIEQIRHVLSVIDDQGWLDRVILLKIQTFHDKCRHDGCDVNPFTSSMWFCVHDGEICETNGCDISWNAENANQVCAKFPISDELRNNTQTLKDKFPGSFLQLSMFKNKEHIMLLCIDVKKTELFYAV